MCKLPNTGKRKNEVSLLIREASVAYQATLEKWRLVLSISKYTQNTNKEAIIANEPAAVRNFVLSGRRNAF